MAFRAALIATLLVTAAAFGVQQRQTSLSPSGHDYKQDCGKAVRPMGMAQKGASIKKTDKPGTGMEPEALEPFQKVYKDGFSHVGCVLDFMYVHGDKFGDNRHSYRAGPIANVSIVHYEAMVPREDREPMTQEVCFELCRTLPDTVFFGIVNGRNCYCAPYFEAMASDNSDCDAQCEGNAGTLCGGKDKSAIFEMHSCSDTQEQLDNVASRAFQLSTVLLDNATAVNTLAQQMDTRASALQEAFGLAGDPVMAAHMQELKTRKVWGIHGAGQITEFAEDLATKAQAADTAELNVATLTGASQAEETTQSLAKDLMTGMQYKQTLDKFVSETSEAPVSSVPDAGKQYYPAMYFIDKQYKEVPATCGGDLVNIMYSVDYDGCASACDAAHVAGCVGFQWVPPTGGMAAESAEPTTTGEPTTTTPGKTGAKGDKPSKPEPRFLQRGLATRRNGKDSMCFLFSKFTSITYYTGCEAAPAPAFLQQSQPATGAEVVCTAKLSKFEGTTLAPDASGKCDQCVKEATKADRCFNLSP